MHYTGDGIGSIESCDSVVKAASLPPQSAVRHVRSKSVLTTNLSLRLVCAAASAYSSAMFTTTRFSICGAVVLVIASFVAAQSRPAAGSHPGVPWPATDGLGRKLPLSDEVGSPHADRFVGIFYFLWLNEINNKSSQGGPHDVARILAADPDALKKPELPLWGPIGTSHYWGEPLYGYYLSTDPWVIRRHAWLLADAGIDTLIFDATNALTYRDVYMKLCEVFEQVRAAGETTPQIAFMVNTSPGR